MIAVSEFQKNIIVVNNGLDTNKFVFKDTNHIKNKFIGNLINTKGF